MGQPFGNAFQRHAASTTADSVKLRLNGALVENFVIQNVQFQFQQQVTMLYEVGSSLVYYVGGRSQGTLNIGRIAGLGQAITVFIFALGQVCSPKDVTLETKGNCTFVGQQVPLTYTLKKTVINQIGGNITAQDIVFNEQVGAMFLDMDVT